MATPPEVMAIGPEVTKLSKLSTYVGHPSVASSRTSHGCEATGHQADPTRITNDQWMANKSVSANVATRQSISLDA